MVNAGGNGSPYRVAGASAHLVLKVQVLPSTLEVPMNEYDEFVAEMIEAGWGLEEIEAAWGKHLHDEIINDVQARG